MPYIYILLATIIFGLAGSSAYLLTQNSKLKTERAYLEGAVQAQNSAIEDMALEAEKYRCSIDDMNKYTENKYKKALQGHERDTCEGKLKSLNAMFQAFHKDTK